MEAIHPPRNDFVTVEYCMLGMNRISSGILEAFSLGDGMRLGNVLIPWRGNNLRNYGFFFFFESKEFLKLMEFFSLKMKNWNIVWKYFIGIWYIE